MITKYYVNENGIYLGGFSEGNPAIPENAIEVPNPPFNANYQIWDNIGQEWIEDETNYLIHLKIQYIQTRQNYINENLHYYLNHLHDHLQNAANYGNSVITQIATASLQIKNIKETETLAQFNALNLTLQYP